MQASGSATPRPADRGMRADAKRNYEKLLTAAAEAFAEHGADDVSLEEIAKRAGVGIGTLYRHFPNRQALLEAVYRDQVEALRARAEELVATKPPAEALATWLRDLVDFGRTKRMLTSAMLTTVKRDSEVMTSSSQIMRRAAADILSGAQQAGVVRADADPADLMRLVHAISMTTEWAGDDNEQADRLLALVLDGLKSQSADRPAR
ncbi:MAG TPA: helix-turn-helix domain-containing protein [Streptosporangiaceae bacterium]|jgi:AcrR family transcriptional regulator|nr:helix-turn-helix domain-containing protein [Streptosporangiaceae bacterium]